MSGWSDGLPSGPVPPRLHTPANSLSPPPFSFFCLLSRNTRKLTKIATRRMTKKTSTNDTPIDSGSVVTAAPIPPTWAHPAATRPYCIVSENMLPEPLNGCNSLLTVKLAKQPMKPANNNILILITFYNGHLNDSTCH